MASVSIICPESPKHFIDIGSEIKNLFIRSLATVGVTLHFVISAFILLMKSFVKRPLSPPFFINSHIFLTEKPEEPTLI